jgi:hypothetical protein
LRRSLFPVPLSVKFCRLLEFTKSLGTFWLWMYRSHRAHYTCQLLSWVAAGRLWNVGIPPRPHPHWHSPKRVSQFGSFPIALMPPRINKPFVWLSRPFGSQYPRPT